MLCAVVLLPTRYTTHTKRTTLCCALFTQIASSRRAHHQRRRHMLCCSVVCSPGRVRSGRSQHHRSLDRSAGPRVLAARRFASNEAERAIRAEQATQRFWECTRAHNYCSRRTLEEQQQKLLCSKTRARRNVMFVWRVITSFCRTIERFCCRCCCHMCIAFAPMWSAYYRLYATRRATLIIMGCRACVCFPLCV